MVKKKNINSKIVHVKFLKGGEGFIQRKELKTMIKINVKVFHGDRENYEFTVSILDRIHVIYQRLLEKD